MKTYTIDASNGRTIHAENMAKTVQQTATLEQRVAFFSFALRAIPVGVVTLTVLAVLFNL